MQSTTSKTPVLVPFLCPACAKPNKVSLIALSRAGAMSCTSCSRRLRAADVSQAMHTPRRV